MSLRAGSYSTRRTVPLVAWICIYDALVYVRQALRYFACIYDIYAIVSYVFAWVQMQYRLDSRCMICSRVMICVFNARASAS